MKTLFGLVLLFCVSCSLFIVTVDHDIYLSTPVNKQGFKFAEPDNAKIFFGVDEGRWRIKKELPTDFTRGYSRTIWFLEEKNQLQLSYFIFMLRMGYSKNKQSEELHKFENDNKLDFLKKPSIHYELIGFDIKSNILPNYVYKTEDSLGVSYFYQFYSGPFLVLIRYQSLIKNDLVRNDFYKFINTIRFVNKEDNFQNGEFSLINKKDF